MQINFKGILEGAYNSIFIKASVEKVANIRMNICRGCPQNSENMKKLNGYKTFRPDFHCTACGCDLHVKTRCLSCECPLGKWKAEVTQEEAQEIEKKMNERNKD